MFCRNCGRRRQSIAAPPGRMDGEIVGRTFKVIKSVLLGYLIGLSWIHPCRGFHEIVEESGKESTRAKQLDHLFVALYVETR